MSKNSTDLNPEKLTLIAFNQFDEEQRLKNNMVYSSIERIGKDGIFRLKHLPLGDFGFETSEKLTPAQLWSLITKEDGNMETDTIFSQILSEVENIFLNFSPWHLRKVINRHLSVYEIEKINVPKFYNAIACSFYFEILRYWQPKLLPGFVDDLLDFINRKNSTYKTASKNLQSDFRGLNRGNEFRENAIDLTNAKVDEMENLFETSGFYNEEQIQKIHALPKGKKMEFGVEMTNLLKQMIKRCDPNNPLKNAVKGLEGRLNQKKYFTYALLSEYFPKEYPPDDQIKELLESDQVHVDKKSIATHKRDRLRKFF